jgi:hypothetical protein
LKNFLSRMLSGVPTHAELQEQVKALAEKKSKGEELTAEEQALIDHDQAIEEMIGMFGGNYKYGDGQGFITPRRAREFEKGFGRAYGAGQVFKGAHFENVVATDENGEEVTYPFMLKYSTIVLSDELVARFPVLARMRERMENAEGGPIDEMVFASGNKVGIPVVKDSGKALEDGVASDQIAPGSIVELSNDNYRLQSNPDHLAGHGKKGVANPTQLGYFLGVLKDLVNDEFDGSKVVYENVAKLIQEGGQEFFNQFYEDDGSFSSSAFRQFAVNSMDGKGNERMLDALQNGVNYNAPHIVNKLFTQLAAKLASATVKLRFPGNKLTLQSAYGAQITTGRPIPGLDPDKARHLQYYVDERGHMVAEVIVPSKSVPKEIQDRLDAGENVYMYADAMGFRIPSTELHSAVALKIVGTYDSRGSSMVIAPKELVPLHGSDFDVDSLFMITRNHTKLSMRQLGLLRDAGLGKKYINNGEPVGYRQGKHGFILNNKFPEKINEVISKLEKEIEVMTEPEAIEKREETLQIAKQLRKQYYQNIIVETYLQAITHPDNRKRMLSPITMEMFNGESEQDGWYKEGTIFRMMQDINLQRYLNSTGKKLEDLTDYELQQAIAVQEIVDLSDPTGNYKVYKSNMEGAALTGVFANAIKALAYMIHSGPKLRGEKHAQHQRLEGQLADLNEVIEKSKEIIEENDKLLTQESNPEVRKKLNAAKKYQEKKITRLEKEAEAIQKEMEKLAEQFANEKYSDNPFLAMDKYGDFVNELTFNGVKYNRMTEYVLDKNGQKTSTPIWEVMDSLVNAAIDNVKEQILPVINANGMTANAISAMLSLGVPMHTITLFMNQPVIRSLDPTGGKIAPIKRKMTEIEELFLAEYGGKYDKATLEGLGLKRTPESLGAYIVNQFASTSMLSDKGLRHQLVTSPAEFSLEDGLQDFNTDHIATQYLVLSELLKAVEIGEDIATLSGALDVVRATTPFKHAYDKMVEKWEKVYTVPEGETEKQLNPKFSYNIPNLMENNPHIKLGYEFTIEKFGKLVREAFTKHNEYFEKAIYKIFGQTRIKLDNDKSISRTKYVDEFMRYIFSGIPLLSTDEVRNARYEYTNWLDVENVKEGHEAWSQQTLEKWRILKKHPDFKNNRFVQSLDIRQNKYTKLYNVRFTAGSNLEFHDLIELEHDFNKLQWYEVAHGEVVKLNKPNESFTELQHDFMRYAILNFGLQFSSVNYTTALPSALIKPYIDQLQKLSEDLINKDSKFALGEEAKRFEDIIGAFEMEMALNHADKLPFLSSKDLVKTEIDLWDGQNIVQVERNAGYDLDTGQYYDLKYKAREGQSAENMPKFIKRTDFESKQEVVYAKLPITGDGVAMYVKVGYGRESSAYFLQPEILRDGYILEDQYVGYFPTLRVAKQDRDSLRLPDSMDRKNLKGMIVVTYQHDDVLRQNPVYRKVTEVRGTTKMREGDDGSPYKEIKVDTEVISKEEAMQSAPASAKIEVKSRKKGTYTELLTTAEADNNFMNSTELNDYFEQKEQKSEDNALEVLEEIAAKGSLANRLMAKTMLKFFKGPLKLITITWDDSIRSEGAVGRFTTDGTVRVAVQRHASKVEQTTMHELMHALTYALLRMPADKLSPAQVEARAKLQQLFIKAKALMKKKYPNMSRQTAYRLSNIDEFVVGLFSDHKFQEKLHGIEVTDSSGDRPTLLQKIWSFVAEMFGIPKGDKSLLLDAYAQTVSLIDNGDLVFKYHSVSDTITEKLESLYDKELSRDPILSNIRETSKETEVALNDDGSQKDHYKRIGLTKHLLRVSDQVTGFMSKILKSKKNEDKSKHWIDRQADRVYGKNEEDHVIYIEGKNRTREEYKDFLRDIEHKGLAKGNIIHKIMEVQLHNELSEKSRDELMKDLEDLYATSTIKGAKRLYDWVPQALPIMLEKMGINALDSQVSPENKDKALPEITVASNDLGYAGTVDSIFRHADGSYTLVDWKTGRSFENEIENELFKYGDTFSYLYNNPKNKAKMQVMFYAFMLKYENPDIKFRDLMAVWAPNEYLALSDDAINRVDVASFLEVIENYYRNEDPDTYYKILQKSPNIFNPQEYNGTSKSVENAIGNDHKATKARVLELREKLRWTMMNQLDRHKMTDEDQRKVAKLMKEYNEIAHEAGLNIQSWNEDIGLFDTWLGDYSNINHPAVKLWKKELDSALRKQRLEANEKVDRFRALLTPVYKEYLRKSGRLQDMAAKLGVLKRKLSYADYNKLYKSMMIKDDKFSKGQPTWRLITEKDPQWKDGTLTDAQKKLLRYTNDSFGEYFGKGGFMNEYAVKNTEQTKTVLELYNSNKAGIDQFKYHRGFLPVIPPTPGDIAAQNKGLFEWSKKRWQHFVRKNLTFFYETQHEGWGDPEQGIPVPYLGSRMQRATEMHSFNLEMVFDRYTRAMTHKKHLDNVHAFGRSMQVVLAGRGGEEGVKNLNGWLEDQLRMQTLRQTQRGIKFSKKGFRGPQKFGKETRINPGKVLDLISNYTSATLMWFGLRGGTTNGIGAMATVAKRAGAMKILKTIDPKGVDMDDFDYNIRNLGKGGARAAADLLIRDAILGNVKNNKTWLVMRDLGLMPNINSMFSDSREMMTARGKLFTQDTAFMFYSLPEEIVASTTMIAMMQSMKLKEPFTKPDGKVAKNMWECYDVVPKEHDDGSITNELVYNGPVRGVVKDENGNLTELRGLADNELSRMKYVYAEMQGAYSDAERTRAHYYFLGRAMLKFKRYLPRLIKNAIGSKAEVHSLGKYVPKLDSKGEPMLENGMTIMQWQEEVMEGRWRVFAKHIGNGLGSVAKFSGLTHLPLVGPLTGKLKNQQYDWKNLSQRDKLNIVEGYLTIATMLGSIAAAATMFGDDDDTTGAMMFRIATSTMNQQWNVHEMGKNTLSMNTHFIGINKTWKLIDAGFKFGFSHLITSPGNIGGLFGEEEAAYLGSDEETRQGARELFKAIPGLASYYSNYRDLVKAGYLENPTEGIFKIYK